MATTRRRFTAQSSSTRCEFLAAAPQGRGPLRESFVWFPLPTLVTSTTAFWTIVVLPLHAEPAQFSEAGQQARPVTAALPAARPQSGHDVTQSGVQACRRAAVAYATQLRRHGKQRLDVQPDSVGGATLRHRHAALLFVADQRQHRHALRLRPLEPQPQLSGSRSQGHERTTANETSASALLTTRWNHPAAHRRHPRPVPCPQPRGHDR